MAPAWKSLAVVFSVWCLPQIFFYGLYNLLGETLNARGVFGPYTWAPVINNVIGIAGLIVFILVYGAATDVNDPTVWNASRTALLAGPATLGVIVQALILIPPLRRAGIHIRPDFKFRGAGLRSASKVTGWVFAVLLVNQVSVLSTMNIGAAANNWREITGQFAPSITAINFTYMIYMMPQSIIATSLSIAIFTRLASAVTDGRMKSVAADFHFGVRTTTILNLWSAAILGAGAIPIFQALAANATRVEISYTALALVMMLPGLASAAIVMFAQRVFFAFEDGRPVFYAVLAPTLVFVAVSWILKANLPGYLWVITVLAAEALSRLGQAGISLHLVSRRLPGVRRGLVIRDTLIYSGISIVSGLVAVGALHLVGPFAPGERYLVKFLGAAWRGVLVVVVVTLVYLLLMAVFERRGFESVLQTLGKRIPVLKRLADKIPTAVLPGGVADEADFVAEPVFFAEGADPDAPVWFNDRLAMLSNFQTATLPKLPQLDDILLEHVTAKTVPGWGQLILDQLYKFSLICQPAPLKHASGVVLENTGKFADEFDSLVELENSRVSEPVAVVDSALVSTTVKSHKLPPRPRFEHFDEVSPLPDARPVIVPEDEPEVESVSEANSLKASVGAFLAPQLTRLRSSASSVLKSARNTDSAQETPSEISVRNGIMVETLHKGTRTISQSFEFAKETVDTLQAGKKVDPTKPTIMLFAVFTFIAFVFALATLGLMPKSSFLDGSETKQQPATVKQVKPAEQKPADEPKQPEAPVLPTAPVVIESAEVISWQNDGGDIFEDTQVIYDGNADTIWVTRYFAVAELPANDTIRLLLKLKEPAQVKEINFTGLMKGGAVDVHVGDDAAKLFNNPVLSSAQMDATTNIALPEGTAGTYVGLNFRQLPKDNTGVFRIKLRDLSIK